MDEVKIDFIVEWINNRAEDAKVDALVVGISGGIDSAVVSTLCAMTGRKTILVTMPIGNQTQSSYDHIKWLAEKYDNVKHVEHNLSVSFNDLIYSNQTLSDRETIKFIKTSNLAMANAASRLRMTALYMVANTFNGLVVGTGNKVEDFGIGFFTKYGDGGVDISPIGSLYKSQVYHMGREMGIISEILSAVPTDGLWEDGRTDEDQIGFTYDELEKSMIMAEHDTFDLMRDKLTERELEAYHHYLHLHKTRKHKMEPIPICKIPRDLL